MEGSLEEFLKKPLVKSRGIPIDFSVIIPCKIPGEIAEGIPGALSESI